MSLSTELLAPIAGDNPAGSDLRYDPVYDKIKEARREDLDVPVGDWATTRKTADWAVVVKLATEALTKRTKDLQIAVWLTEGLLRRDGFAGFRQGLELTMGLLDQFWDNVYPELEDGDSEMRAAPLGWLGLKLDLGVKLAPITAGGYGYLSYFESQSIPTEAQAEEDYEGGIKAARNEAIESGKATPEQFEAALAATNKEWYRALVADIDGCLELLQELEAKGDALFGSEALLGLVEITPVLSTLTSALNPLILGLDAVPVDTLTTELQAQLGPVTQPLIDALNGALLDPLGDGLCLVTSGLGTLLGALTGNPEDPDCAQAP